MKLKTAIGINITLILINLLTLFFGYFLAVEGWRMYILAFPATLLLTIIATVFDRKSILIGLFVLIMLAVVYFGKIYCINKIIRYTLFASVLFKLIFTRKIKEEGKKKRAYEIFAYTTASLEVITIINTVI